MESGKIESEIKATAKDAGEVARWAVFLFVILPLLPVAFVALILGAAWAISKEFFSTGAKAMSVWDGYDSNA